MIAMLLFILAVVFFTVALTTFVFLGLPFLTIYLVDTVSEGDGGGIVLLLALILLAAVVILVSGL